MIINNICSPAIIYLGFSITQIIIDIYKMMYNTAFLKFLVSIIFTIILNILCDRGLNIISWIIVFIPFIFMTVITSILLVMFGLDPFFGKLNYNIQNFNDNDIPMSQNPRDNNSLNSIPQNPRDNNSLNSIPQNLRNNNSLNSNNNSLNSNNNSLNSNNNSLNNSIIPDINSQNNIINKENSDADDLPINRILDNNKKSNKNTQYTELQNESTYTIKNRNTESSKNQNLNIQCNKSCLDHCSNRNNINDSNYCSFTCKNICNDINYKTI